MGDKIHTLKPGRFLRGDTYRILRFISSGGFGCTYEAEHVMLEKRVAIKEFFVKDFCNRDEATSHITVGTQSKKGLVEKMRLKFIDEAKSLCKLHHPGIVSVSDVFEENGTAYFVMDYVEGRSLREIVDQEGPLTEERAVRYIRQVAEALQHVHANNRLHLDIKPGNIMINSEDRPVLIDFGASKQYDELDGENTSTLMGKTPGYAPPEQMSNSVVKFMPATDIYALGATLYKLLTGITPLDVNLRISGEELAPMPTNVSPGTQKAVSEAMQINKRLRPKTLREFIKVFDANEESVSRFTRRNAILQNEETVTLDPTESKIKRTTYLAEYCYAYFGWRVIGWIIDLPIIYLSAGLFTRVIEEALPNEYSFYKYELITSAVSNLSLIIIPLFYYFILEAFCKGRTLGKFVCGLKVVDIKGNNPLPSRILIRTLCRFIPLDGLSFIGSKKWSSEGKLIGCWHDSISKTYVIRLKKVSEFQTKDMNEKC